MVHKVNLFSFRFHLLMWLRDELIQHDLGPLVVHVQSNDFDVLI